MKITVIATNDSENFPLGTDLTCKSLTCISQNLCLYEAELSCGDMSASHFTIQTVKISILSLEEIIVEGYFSMRGETEKLAFLGLSIKK